MAKQFILCTSNLLFYIEKKLDHTKNPQDQVAGRFLLARQTWGIFDVIRNTVKKASLARATSALLQANLKTYTDDVHCVH